MKALAAGAEIGGTEMVEATVYQKHRPVLTRKGMYTGWRLPGAGRLRGWVILREKLRTEAPVNGGRNYNGPKVAKFLVV